MPSSYTYSSTPNSTASIGSHNYIGSLNDHLIWNEYKGEIADRYGEFYKKDILSFMGEIGMRDTVSTPSFGHFERDRMIGKIHPAGSTGAPGAGVALEMTIASSDHKGDTSFPVIDSVWELANGTFVRVVGKDTGTAATTGGVRADGSALTAGGAGGASGAHVITLAPISSTMNIDALTSASELIWRGANMVEGGTPKGGVVTDLLQYKNFVTQIPHHYETTYVAATEIVWLDLELDRYKAGGAKTKVWALNEFGTNDWLHRQAITHTLFFTPSGTNNIAALTAGGQSVQLHNGIVPQILADGYTHPYSSSNLTLQDFATITKYLKQYGGVTEYCIWAGVDAEQEILDLMRNNGVLSNGAVVYSKDTEEKYVNFDFTSFKYNSVTFHIKRTDLFDNVQQSGAVGFGYPGDAIFVPMSSQMVNDLETKKNVSRKRLRVVHKATEGMVFDENFHKVRDGFETNDTAKLYFNWLFDGGAELTALNDFVYLKRV